MHQYLRLIREIESADSPSDEMRKLQAWLATAPGVETIKKVERHPKGGYSVTFECSSDVIDPMIEHVLSHGYRPAFP